MLITFILILFQKYQDGDLKPKHSRALGHV